MKKVLFAAVLASACGSSTESREPLEPLEPPAARTTPAAATEPLVQTSDVSILYPLPLAGASMSFVRPTEAGAHGELLPRASFDTLVPTKKLDGPFFEQPSDFDHLALVSLRLDHCSARKGPGTCTTEVRAVFQAIYDDALGAAATDGAVHVVYDVREDELVTMMRELLALRKANGNVAPAGLEPSPILSAQGLDGAYAKGLRAIIGEHLGADRIARVTAFDHAIRSEIDAWSFTSSDREGGTIFGSSALDGPLTETIAEGSKAPSDDVAALVGGGRPPSDMTYDVVHTIRPAFEAALRVEDPKVHNAETTSCTNCHLADSARVIGEDVYGLAGGTPNASYANERASVTNVHAFGYLHRKVSIMRRTANESVVVRDWMDQKLR